MSTPAKTRCGFMGGTWQLASTPQPGGAGLEAGNGNVTILGCVGAWKFSFWGSVAPSLHCTGHMTKRGRGPHTGRSVDTISRSPSRSEHQRGGKLFRLDLEI